MEDYVHVIIFSAAYGILLLVVVSHLIGRWQYRRKTLKKWTSHIPGDKSFKNKYIKEQITEDFERIQRLTSDPRLNNNALPSSSFGGKKGCDYPGHWNRMKAFDKAADFVTSHVQILGDDNLSPSSSLSLPHFLNLLKERGVINSCHDDIVTEAIESYNNARFNPGEFTSVNMEGFNHQLTKLRQVLSSVHSLSPLTHSLPQTPTIPEIIPTTSWHDRVSVTTSREPLIGEDKKPVRKSSVDKEVTQPKISITSASSTSTSGRKDSRSYRPVSLELSPLISGIESTSTPTPLGLISPPRTDSRVFVPGTPV